jgi:ribosomal protein S18 acetylase RimI-like enzyme
MMMVMMIDNNLFTQYIVIRNASRNDLSALEWNGEFQKFRVLYQDVYQSSLRGDAIMWIADHKTRGIIGQLFVQLVSTRKELADGMERAYLYGFRIQPSFRGRGIGSQMLTVAESDLRERGYRKISLNVSRENEEARQLYERNGYVIVAAEPGNWSYIDDRGQRQEVNEPAWRMEKEILR